jgi:hypothetical protein
MKKVAILLIVSGCSTIDLIPHESAYYGVDFRPYTKQGFLITPEKYSGNYESIGIVEYVYVSPAELRTIQEGIYSDGRPAVVKRWVTVTPALSAGVDSLYARSREMGADAIMNFTFSNEQRTHVVNTKTIVRPGYRVSGYAIKRK